MSISSVSSMLDNSALQAQIDLIDQELQQTITAQQDTTTTQAAQFAQSTIQPSQQS